jgi:CRISPR-associated protein Cas2
MHILITYDISEHKTRSLVFNFLQKHGYHTQRSVFECQLDKKDITSIYNFIKMTINIETDSVLFYPVCRHCVQHIEILGLGLHITQLDWMIL